MSASLPVAAVERTLERLTVTYGRRFTDQYAGVDSGAVKSSWAYELSGFAQRLDAIAWALENLPEKAPNVIEFRNLCRAAPQQAVQRLPAPPPDPQRVAAELAKLGQQREAVAKGRAWYGFEGYLRLAERVKGGYQPTMAQAEMLKTALAHMPPELAAEHNNHA